MAANSGVAMETAIVTGIRVCLFYFCRTYLLRSLYHDLRHLQLNSESSFASAFELKSHLHTPTLSPSPSALNLSITPHESTDDLTLPAPSTTPKRPARYSQFLWPTQQRVPLKVLTHAQGGGNYQSSLARSTFALCFSESCVLFSLVMCQGLNVLTARTRTLNWNISLTILVALILLLIPLLQCAFITLRSNSSLNSSATTSPSPRRSPFWSVLLAMIPYTFYLYTVYRIPVPSALANSGLITKSLSRLTVVGVLILGLISGYGAISTAWMFFQDMKIIRFSSSGVSLGLKSAGGPTTTELSSAELSLTRIRSDLNERKQEIARRAAMTERDGASSSLSNKGWLTTMFSTKGEGDMSGIQRELKGLEALEAEMTKNVNELRLRMERVEFSRTFKGRLWGWAGWIFGLYCVFRVLSSTANLILPSRSSSPNGTTTPDMVTHLLVYLLSLLPIEAFHFSDQQIVALSRQASLVMVGGIVLVSVRGILRGIGWVLRLTSGRSRNDTGSTTPGGITGSNSTGSSGLRNRVANFMVLVLAQVMGLYLLSTLIQLRLSFPPQNPQQPQSETSAPSLFSTLPSYEVFNPLFDWMFLVSAFTTILGRWLGSKVGL